MEKGIGDLPSGKMLFAGPAVKDALLSFCRQEEEFAQAVVQGGSFKDCMTSVLKGVASHISDLEAYRRAVRFYFPGADVKFHMTVNLCASVEAEEPEEAESKVTVLDLEDFL